MASWLTSMSDLPGVEILDATGEPAQEHSEESEHDSIDKIRIGTSKDPDQIDPSSKGNVRILLPELTGDPDIFTPPPE
ncbi:MAG: hypothetical protein R3330_16280 [Saprospiraceae bacterium]|nr:hypothetical protein [Saprospiraceae bacterium]